MEIKIDINEDVIAEAVTDQVEGCIRQEVRDQIALKVEEAARDITSEELDRAIRHKLRVAVVEVLDEGWQKTDRYGNPEGKKVTLRGRIEESFNTSKGYGQQSMIEILLSEQFNKIMREEFSAQIAKARAKLQKMIDDEVMEKIGKAFKAAIGA